MLCEASAYLGFAHSFWLTWAVATALGVALVCAMSIPLFYYYYVSHNVTYEKWLNKTNPQFPPPSLVRDEILTMLKGVGTATICPALSLWLSWHGYSSAYCGMGGFSWKYQIGTFFATWLASDFVEFYYHRLGHCYAFFWKHHKSHHHFYNPTPFAVIADEYVDQFVRSTPLLVFPLIMPMNIDMLFLQYGAFFYAYGVYLHWGYELPWLSAHNRFINTSFHHHCHHAKSFLGKPYHTGFFIRLWDNLFGSVYDKPCFCTECTRNTPARSREAFAKIELPDYSVLLSPSFWLNAQPKASSD